MRYYAKLYFDKPVDERTVQALINQEFEMDEVVLNGVFEDKRGELYASVSVSDDVPLDVMKLLGNKKVKVTSTVKEKTMRTDKKNIIELPENLEIEGRVFEAGTKIEVQEKENLKESHNMEIAKDLSMVRFDDGDSNDVEYIAQDIFDGIVNGVGMSRYIANSVKDDVLEQLGYLFDDLT